ncbi:MAG TPA: phosphatidylserine decarboxylase [Rhizomicrobium sp.]|jgi:phosphatidylserine decarboxylase|nr:phosphatidylserine decarboxylase [Rhizomicrobium sp.]
MPFRIPIHREGWPFIAFAVVLNFLIWLFSPVAALIFLAVTLWVIAFFRDPERTPPPDEHLLVSPADGRILPIVQAIPPEELGMGVIPMTRISIFMNVFNVHVNRVPCDGTVTKLAYRPGKFINAAFDKASVDNERMSIRLKVSGPDGGADRDIAFVQIAGLIARRIVCDVKEGQRLCRADRFGIIRFGSRLDVYLPEGVTVLAREGRTVRAGSSVLASFQS